jgi:hypothetical protein
MEYAHPPRGGLAFHSYTPTWRIVVHTLEHMATLLAEIWTVPKLQPGGKGRRKLRQWLEQLVTDDNGAERAAYRGWIERHGQSTSDALPIFMPAQNEQWIRALVNVWPKVSSQRLVILARSPDTIDAMNAMLQEAGTGKTHAWKKVYEQHSDKIIQ